MAFRRARNASEGVPYSVTPTASKLNHATMSVWNGIATFVPRRTEEFFIMAIWTWRLVLKTVRGGLGEIDANGQGVAELPHWTGTVLDLADDLSDLLENLP